LRFLGKAAERVEVAAVLAHRGFPIGTVEEITCLTIVTSKAITARLTIGSTDDADCGNFVAAVRVFADKSRKGTGTIWIARVCEITKWDALCILCFLDIATENLIVSTSVPRIARLVIAAWLAFCAAKNTKEIIQFFKFFFHADGTLGKTLSAFTARQPWFSAFSARSICVAYQVFLAVVVSAAGFSISTTRTAETLSTCAARKALRAGIASAAGFSIATTFAANGARAVGISKIRSITDKALRTPASSVSTTLSEFFGQISTGIRAST